MASRSPGTLTIDLVAKVGGFVPGMDKAERASEKWAKQVQKDAAASSAALLAVGGAVQAAALAAGTAGFALLKSTSEQVDATDQWAKSLKISTQELLAWQFAAEKAGISGDNMADIFKDLSDKIGDAVLNKSGEAVDALNSLGLSADKLSKVSPDKQLLAIGEALGKISTNAGKVTILESLGNDFSKLLPLFDNNNAKLTQFIQLAKDYGVAPDPQSIDDLIKVNTLFQDMEAQVKGLKMEIAAGLAHVDLSPLNNSLSDIHDVLTDPQVLQGIVDLVSQVAQLAIKRNTHLTVGVGIAQTKTLAKLANHAAKKWPQTGGVVDLSNIDRQRRLMALVPVEDVWEVGRRISKKLNAMGVTTAKDLSEQSTWIIRKHYNVVLERTVRELRGEPCLELEEFAPTKQQIVCSRSFGSRITEYMDMRQAVCAFAERAAEKLRKERQYCRQIAVFVRTSPHADGEVFYGNQATGKLLTPSNDTRDIIRVALDALDRIWVDGHRYMKAGVMLGDFFSQGVAHQSV